MDFNTIFSIFDKYGWGGLVCVIFVGLLIYLFKDFSKKTKDSMSESYNKLSDLITTQNRQLVEGMQETNKELLKHLLVEHDNKVREIHQDSMEQRNEIDDEINDKLKELFHSAHCGRIGILEFHNSKENLSGLSFLWYDMHYERQSKSLSTISDKITNRKASELHPVINRINASDINTIVLHRKDIEALYEESSVLYDNLANKLNLQHVIYSGIYNTKTNEIMGILCLEYHTQKHSEEFIEGLLPEVEDYAVAISALLTFHRKGTK